MRVHAAQLFVTASLSANVRAIRDAVAAAAPGDVVVTPEGSLTGYEPSPPFLERIDVAGATAAVDELATEAASRGVVLWVGALLPVHGSWWNMALGLAPDGRRFEYRKVNLATAERLSGLFRAGDALPVFDLEAAPTTVSSAGPARIAAQICRDLRFPGQWERLAERGAAVFVHLNNAAGNPGVASVWRSHVVSRAAENQRFVVSANAASEEQSAPTLVVGPDGDVRAEAPPGEVAIVSVDVDLRGASDRYLGQRRLDL